MDIIINTEKINKIIRNMERIVSKNISLPILSTILLKTEKNSMKISATNLEMGLNYWIGAKINKEGEIAIPARIFSGFLSSIEDEKINFIADKNFLKINSNSYKTKLLGFDPKDFPIIPRLKKEKQISVDAEIMRRGLISVIDSVLLSETRPELSGVFVGIKENKIEFAATDSFRLSEMSIQTPNNNTVINFIIPRLAAIEIIKIIDGLTDKINLSVTDNQLLIYNDDFEFITRLIDGRYPDYKKIIPDKIVSTVKINRANLEKNIRTAGIFSSSIYDISIKVGNQKTEINAKNSDRGDIITNVPSELKNTPFEVSLNYNYFLDGLKNISTSNVLIQYTGDGSPLLLKPENDNSFVYLIMPLRS